MILVASGVIKWVAFAYVNAKAEPYESKIQLFLTGKSMAYFTQSGHHHSSVIHVYDLSVLPVG